MGFQGVGGDPGVIAPDLSQQFLARHGLGPGAVEVFEDVGFLLGQADLLRLVIDQDLGRRTELIGADPEDRVLGLFVAAQMGTDAGQQDRKPERLGHIVIGPRLQPQNGVGIGGLAGQHDDRGRNPVLAQQAAGLAAVHVGQVDVQQDQVGPDLAAHADTLGRGRGLNRAKRLVQGQLLGQGFAQVVVVVDDEDGLGRGHDYQNGERCPIRQGLDPKQRGFHSFQGVSEGFRSPNSDEPTRTWVAPKRIAVS